MTERDAQMASCPMNLLLREIMGPWTAYALWVLSNDGPLRFGELKRRIPGVSSKVLTQRLRRLERAGLVFRRYRPTVPPEVTYGLKPRGRELSEALKSLEVLAFRWARADDRRRASATRSDAGGGPAGPSAPGVAEATGSRKEQEMNA